MYGQIMASKYILEGGGSVSNMGGGVRAVGGRKGGWKGGRELFTHAIFARYRGIIGTPTSAMASMCWVNEK